MHTNASLLAEVNIKQLYRYVWCAEKDFWICYVVYFSSQTTAFSVGEFLLLLQTQIQGNTAFCVQ